ncbi:MAG: P-II family nitrogen regulator [Nitrospinota bacterium]
MELLICVINKPEVLDEVLTGLLEAGISGCTVIESQGMGQIISRDVPIFSGFKSIFSGSREHNYTIFSVIKEKNDVERAIKTIEEIYGSFEEPNSGLLFTLPISRCHGLVSNA